MVRFSCVCKERDYSAGYLRAEVLGGLWEKRMYSWWIWLVGWLVICRLKLLQVQINIKSFDSMG